MLHNILVLVVFYILLKLLCLPDVAQILTSSLECNLCNDYNPFLNKEHKYNKTSYDLKLFNWPGNAKAHVGVAVGGIAAVTTSHTTAAGKVDPATTS